MIASLLQSNAVHLAGTAAFGALAYLLVARLPLILTVVSAFAVLMLTLSFAFDLGEIYSYFWYYKRAFWVFGDDVTTWLAPLFLWALIGKKPWLALGLAAAILFSGTKISLVVLAFMFLGWLVIDHARRRESMVVATRSFAIAGAIYLALGASSPFLIEGGNATVKFVRSMLQAPGDSGGGAETDDPFATSQIRFSQCEGSECLYPHFERPAQDRIYSAIGGLWMTLQGGFAGPRYPNTPDEFADLMMAANPWGINDRFNLDRQRWRKMGTVQTPYLRFGAGYGPGLLLALLAGIAAVGVVAVRNLVDGERGPLTAFTLFFIVNSVVNQTQAWLTPGPIMFVVGFSVAHIFVWRWRYNADKGHGRATVRADA